MKTTVMPVPFAGSILTDYRHVCAFFSSPKEEYFKRDNPNAEVHLYDTGHFALETNVHEIAAVIRDFLGRHL